MKYMLLIHQGSTPTPYDQDEWSKLSPDEQNAVFAAYKEINETPGVTSGLQMQPPETATTVRVEGRQTLTTDGPFVAVKEALGGYLFFEADDLDAAIALAAKVPAASMGGAVEVDRSWSTSDPRRDLSRRMGPRRRSPGREAFATAAERWPRDGTPTNPGAWLVTTAKNRAIDRIRRERTLNSKTRLLEIPEATEDELDETTIPDERLELVFTCCHPSLALEAQLALTLRALGGLTTAEVARAFLVPEETMAKRLMRAKAKIKAAAIPFRVPAPEVLPDRLAAVLAVFYLIYNEGYGGRQPLAAEAIRLTRALAELMPDELEVHGLLALMLINDARRDARFADGSIVLLADQDRSLWDRDELAEGRAVLARASALGGRGPYALQASIASAHLDEPPDWTALADLYDELAHVTGSPVVKLNRAVAIAEAGDVEGALRELDSLDLDGYHYLHSTRAELLRRLDRTDDAREAFERALELVHSDAERRFIEQRLAELAAPPSD
jgi:RNA polymerase sigma-70 factor (ECF subfamily)